MKTLALILFCFTVNFLAAQEDRPTTPQIAMKIGLEDTIFTRNMNIQFMEVLEDSRCPKDVVCVWAGQARVKVNISGPGLDEQELELTLGKKEMDVIITGEDYILKGVALTPYPTTENVGKREYALLVVEEKL